MTPMIFRNPLPSFMRSKKDMIWSSARGWRVRFTRTPCRFYIAIWVRRFWITSSTVFTAPVLITSAIAIRVSAAFERMLTNNGELKATEWNSHRKCWSKPWSTGLRFPKFRFHCIRIIRSANLTWKPGGTGCAIFYRYSSKHPSSLKSGEPFSFRSILFCSWFAWRPANISTSGAWRCSGFIPCSLPCWEPYWASLSGESACLSQ